MMMKLAAFAFLTTTLLYSQVTLMGAMPVNFADFDARARQGEPLSVVFFGGSLTWGANASDPQLTSYRALMGKYLAQRYPKSSFTFHDASIGGTGSMLGIFRLQRDVLSKNPDLVFLDFTLNDDLWGTDPQTLGAYEVILRQLIGRGVPVVQVFMTDQSCAKPDADLARVRRYIDHKKLSEAYGTAVGDVLAYVHQKVSAGQADPARIWAFGDVHPDDVGYQLYFEAVRDGYERAVREKLVSTVPDKPVFSDAYANHKRINLVDTELPPGWARDKTFRTSLWFDGLSSRWMGDVATWKPGADQKVQPLRIPFTGTFVAVFGEADEHGLGFRATVDGKPLLYQARRKDAPTEVFPFDTRRFGQGRLFVWRVLSDGLPPGEHVLEIAPIVPPEALDVPAGQKIKAQLRIESVCVAG